MWRALAIDSEDMPLTVTVRSSSHGGAPSTGTGAAFTIAPVGASGNLVYWSPTGSTNAGTGMVGNTLLSGMSVGGESVTQVLVPSDVGSQYALVPGIRWTSRTTNAPSPASAATPPRRTATSSPSTTPIRGAVCWPRDSRGRWALRPWMSLLWAPAGTTPSFSPGWESRRFPSTTGPPTTTSPSRPSGPAATARPAPPALR